MKFVWICEIRICMVFNAWEIENKETAVVCCNFFPTVSPRISLKHTLAPWSGTTDEDIHVQQKTFHCETRNRRLDGKPADCKKDMLTLFSNKVRKHTHTHTQKLSPDKMQAIFSFLSWIPFPWSNRDKSYSKNLSEKGREGESERIQKPNKATFTTVLSAFGPSVT